jgi:large subunit ribosomal protein L25
MSVDILNVEKRETRGKRHAKRLRAAGKIPAILYGHRQEAIALTLAADEVQAALRHHAHLFELKGSVSASAFLKQVQWDAFGSQVLHVDLTRVSLTEAVQVALEVVLRGVAPGAKKGGIVDQQLRQVEIECAANAIPENLIVSINELDVDETITAGQLELPRGAKLITDPDAVICSCVIPAAVELEAEAAAAEAAEPELIGRQAEEEAEAES